MSGRKEELIARVFVAHENNVPLVKSAEEVQREIALEYRNKLLIEGENLPDPFQVQDGWIKEEDGVSLWPTTLYPDIFNSISFHPSELKNEDLSDYKTSKAYSYYATGWLNPLYYHAISDESKFCFLKTTCRPSQRISDVPHRLWVCLSKTSGSIMKAHCSCMAGISQTYNHVAAALFRIESAVRLGLNSPSCTSKPCSWLPSSKNVAPVKIKDLKLSRGDFGQRGKKRVELNSSPKKRYDPTVNLDCSLSLQDLSEALKKVCDNSIIFTTEVKQTKVTSEEKEKILTLDDFLHISKTPEEFLMHMEYFPSHVDEIERQTQGQSNNPLWFEVRKHTISASKAHVIKTRIASIEKAKAENKILDMGNIFKTISGRGPILDLPALKYGRVMEAEAVSEFLGTFKETHQKVSAFDCGIFICKDRPFIGGSPDQILECKCCGKFCLEIKCPFSIRDKSPIDAENGLKYLELNDANQLSLKRNHAYYTQCQIQMAVTGIPKSYFVVWTAHGLFTEMITFDKDLWGTMKHKLTDFYIDYYVPSLFS